MTPIVWAALLFVLAMAFIVLELFIPSGGVLGFVSGCSLVASLAMVFTGVGATAALVYLAGLLVLIPMIIVSLVKWWPYTPVGRRILNLPPGKEQEITGPADYNDWKSLIGQFGIAKTTMLPGGMVAIGERVLDAISDGTAIEKGEPVEVISTEGSYLVVRKTDVPIHEIEAEPEASGSNPESLVEDPFAD